MNNGIIQGGWEYVWAAYLICWVMIGLYSFSLVWRAKKEDKSKEQHGDQR